MSVTVAPTVEASNTPPRVRLDVSASAGETSTTVLRNNPDGSQSQVRTSDGNPLPISSGTGLLYDYEAPFGQAVSYTSQESPTIVSAQVTVGITVPWLVHPGVPALSQPISLRPGSLLEETLPMRQGVFYPMGRPTPVVVTDGTRKSGQSTLILVMQTADDLSNMRALLSDGSALLLNLPPSLGAEFDTCYISISDVKISRFTDVVIDSYRDVTLPFTVVDRPSGGTQAQRTYADLLAAYASYRALDSAYASYTSLLSGP